MRKPTAFLSSIIFLVVTLSVIQVAVSNSLSTTGSVLGKINDEISQYAIANAVLGEQVLTASSFTHIASKAGEMGFVDNRNVVFVKFPLPLASKQ